MARIAVEAYRWLDWWLGESGQAVEGDRALLVELVESIESDKWRNGRWFCPFDPAQDLYDCQPRPGLHILMYLQPDADGEWAVGIESMTYDAPGHDEQYDDLPF
ncbi:hypothetical protein [Kribbella sp. NPDC006257]|uniref:hypothetical protein n=1 Tax=Kribbella sp. NPDC006257 TaxID=3156738 RepID=UPI0033A03155